MGCFSAIIQSVCCCFYDKKNTDIQNYNVKEKTSNHPASHIAWQAAEQQSSSPRAIALSPAARLIREGSVIESKTVKRTVSEQDLSLSSDIGITDIGLHLKNSIASTSTPSHTASQAL